MRRVTPVDCDLFKKCDDKFNIDLNQEQAMQEKSANPSAQQTVGADPSSISDISKNLKINDRSQLSQKRGRFASITEAIQSFDMRFIDKLQSSIILGRFEKIEYSNKRDGQLDEGFEFLIPEILVKQDTKDSYTPLIKYVMYDKVKEDYEKIEKRLLKMVSYYLEKYEKIARVKDFYMISDRFVILQEVMEYETRYQFAKLRLVEQLVEVYDHVCDPLDQYQYAEYILNVIEQIPLFDLKSHYFKESY